MAEPNSNLFPWDVLGFRAFPEPDGELIREVEGISMVPPYPWGHRMYGRLLRERCAELPGDMVEAGAGLGGMSVFLAAVAGSGRVARKMFSVDTFEGLPPPHPIRDNPYFLEGDYAAHEAGDRDLEQSLRIVTGRFGVGESVIPVRGRFADVLPTLEPQRPLCFVHIDADLYGSVLEALEHLYDRVVEGGVVAIDDFFHPVQGPLRAAAEFFNARGATPRYHVVFPYSVFVFKGEGSGSLERAIDGNAYSLEWLRRDEVLIEALERSLAASETDSRPHTNCAALLEALRREEQYADIYDYWRALEEFWQVVDKDPTGRPEIRLDNAGAEIMRQAASRLRPRRR